MSFLDNAKGAVIGAAAGAASSLVSAGLSKAFGSGIAGALAGGGSGTKQSSSFVHPRNRTDYMLNVVRTGDPTRRNIRVRAMLPEDFSFDLSADWSAPFAEGLVSSDKLNMAAQLAGMKWSTQATSANFWTGSNHVEFTFPLIFTAEDGYADVLAPIRDLVELHVPTLQGGFFQSPGPRFKIRSEIGDIYQSTKNMVTGKKEIDNSNTTPPKKTTTAADAGSSAGDKAKAVGDKLRDMFQYEGTIQLQIGRFMLIPSVVITNISNNFKVLMGPDGVPMQATVNVSFRTHTTPSADDIKGWFQKTIPGDEAATTKKKG